MILHRSVGECRVVVVGDTPRDVECATSLGARSVAVATGSHDAAELEGRGADVTVGSLEESERILELLASS
jgi:phosphoglycolate phosphatase-like HAD superfamily hydrolase